MARAKIALLYVGGSIGMKVNQKTGRIEPIESLNDIHRFLPELQKEVSIQFFSMSNVGSSDIDPTHWVEIAETIKEAYDQFDGFVVVHGTNTMAYTAAALSFALQGLSKPVILTGALLPINDLTGDGRMNLIFAIRAAQLDIAEVCVCLGPRVLRGNRTKKVDQSFLSVFDSYKCSPLAEFHMSVDLGDHRAVRRKRTLKPSIGFDPEVIQITLNPGLSDKYLDAILEADPHGIILRSYGPGMLPTDLLPWLKKVSKTDIAIVITSQMVRGGVDLQYFRKQLAMSKLGVISGKDMTFECSLVKLMWALAQTKNPKRVQELMEKT